MKIVRIEFTADLVIGERVSFANKHEDSDQFYEIYEVFKHRRTTFNEANTYSPTTIAGERSAIEYRNALYLDYFRFNSNDTYLEVVDNVVSIHYPNSYELTTDGYLSSNKVIITITELPEATPINITDLTFLTNNSCESVLCQVTTDNLATTLNLPSGTVENNTNNPFSFVVLRSQNFYLRVENDEGSWDSENVTTTPRLLNENTVTININPSPNGATVVITSLETYSNLEYSLDNVNFQTDNTFNGQPDGDYTLFVRDNFDCHTSKDFKIESFEALEPYVLLPKSNPFIFAERVEWDYITKFKTDENTLSCEADVVLPKKEIQLFQKQDEPVFQFKSSYRNHEVKAIKANGSEVIIPVTKITNNLRRVDKRDCRIFSVNGKLGIYFISGNRYNETTNQIEDQYVLNGALPTWGKINNYVKIQDSWQKIKSIYFDDEKYAEVLIVDKNYTEAEANDIITCLYHADVYEEWEFTTYLAQFNNENIRLQIHCTDTNYDDKTFLSEEICIKDHHLNTIHFACSNSKNTADINYSRGLRHIIRVKYDKYGAISEDEADINKTDDKVYLNNATVRELTVFYFVVTTALMQKIVQISSLDTVYLNGVGYVKSSIDVSEHEKDTNLHKIKITMIKTGNVLTVTKAGTYDFDNSDIELPNLVDYGDGMVKY